MLVYDVTNAESFNRLNFWREKFLTNSKLKTRGNETEEAVPVSFVLLGNKTDEPEKRQVCT